MGVEVDRQADLLFQGLDQQLGGGGFQQACHVFQAQNMRACGFEFLRAGDVVFQIIFGAGRVQHIAGIADRAFANLVRLQHRVHRDAHVFNPVQGVENAEHVNPGGGGLFDEGLHDVVGVCGIAHAIRTAQQHLRHQVRHGGAQIAQALPRAFLQEAVSDIKCRPAPTFDAEKLRQVGGIGRGCLDHVD